MLNRADRTFQRDLVRCMARARALGTMEEDPREVQKWASRYDRFYDLALHEYGEAAAEALREQAERESVDLGPSMVDDLIARLAVRPHANYEEIQDDNG